MMERTLMAVAAAAAIAAAAAVGVFSAFFALYALVEPHLGAPGAAVAAGIYALRNPQLIAAVLRAFMDKPSNPKR